MDREGIYNGTFSVCSFSNNPRVLGGSVVVKSSNQVNKPWVILLKEAWYSFTFSTTSFHLSTFTITHPRNILYSSSSRLALKESSDNWLLINKRKAYEIRLLLLRSFFGPTRGVLKFVYYCSCAMCDQVLLRINKTPSRLSNC